jgi:hypothetical protein
MEIKEYNLNKCDKCGSTKKGITLDGKFEYIIHNPDCIILNSQTNS